MQVEDRITGNAAAARCSGWLGGFRHPHDDIVARLAGIDNDVHGRLPLERSGHAVPHRDLLLVERPAKFIPEAQFPPTPSAWRETGHLRGHRSPLASQPAHLSDAHGHEEQAKCEDEAHPCEGRDGVTLAWTRP